MANTADKTAGFRVAGTLSGNPTHQIQKCYSDTDKLYKGDIVVASTDGQAPPQGNGAYMAVNRANDGVGTLLPIGVVVGWEPNPDALGNLYHAASATYAVYVNTDPNLILEVAGDGAGTIPGVNVVGANFDYTVTAGTDTTGASNMQLDESSSVTTADTPFKCIGIVDSPNNEGGAAFQRFRVIFNMHAFKGSAGTVGLA